MIINFHAKKYSWYNPLRYTSLAIKSKSNDIFYHVSYTVKNDIYESTFFTGVTKNRRRDDIAKRIYLKIPEENELLIKSDFEALIGKKYDFKGVLLGFFGFKIEDSNAYFCSELFNVVLKHGYGIGMDTIKTNLSPKDVRMICIGINATCVECSKSKYWCKNCKQK